MDTLSPSAGRSTAQSNSLDIYKTDFLGELELETHAERAYQHLRRKLIAGDFQPGQRLLYGPIGKEIDVSATPVREAAGRLANEGLVDLVPQMGAIVRRLSTKDLREIYEVRELIEPYAASRVAKRINEVDPSPIQMEMQRMIEAAKKMADIAAESSLSEEEASETTRKLTREFDDADYHFHMKVLEATGNHALVRTASQSHVLTRVFGIRRHDHDAASMAETCREHQAILTGICEGNAGAARDASLDHIRHGLNESLEEAES